ncbi:MAG: hypothetical protein Q9216_004398 [Gyalolechia sp. 2 TL-2023]
MQYDEIVALHEEMRKLPGERFETYKTQEALAPYIKGAKVLDLACGSGYYSHLMLSWGASQVVDVDISIGMIEAANAATSSDKARFMVADCSIPTKFDDGPFNIVFGGYAPSGAVLANMFRNIDINLKEGGFFFGVTTCPTQDPRRFNEIALERRPLFWDRYPQEPTGDVEDGVSTRVTTDIEPEKVQFHNDHLRKDVYGQAARDGGMDGRLLWDPTIFPEDDSQFLDGRENVEEEWAIYMEMPHFVIVAAEKRAKLMEHSWRL